MCRAATSCASSVPNIFSMEASAPTLDPALADNSRHSIISNTSTRMRNSASRAPNSGSSARSVAAAAIWWGTTGSPSGSGEAVPQPAPVFAERRLPLEVIIQPPGGEELAYDPAVPLYVGDTFWFVSDVSPDRRAVMVLCFYTGAVRSVLPYTPLPPADGVSSRRSTFGFDGDAKSPVGFRLQTDVSTPLLALLFPDGRDADPAELEAAVEAALEDLDSWPATRTLDPPKDADPPTALLVDDERIRRYPSPHVTRSGPPPVAGEVARRPKLVSLVQSLASRFGEVHGVLVHVDATR